jgi:serine/threonine-protein kinase
VLLGILTVAVAIVSILVVHLLRQPAVGRVTTRRIDRYDVREVLGRGGMATVYRAVDSLNPRNGALALKVMDEGHLGDPDLVHKFLREGQMLQQFNEADPEAPLVRVFHWGQAGGTGVPFIAMELLEGQNLLQALKRQGKFSLPQAAHLVGGVARALIPAHAVGVYHRDLTPDNVILVNTPRGGYYLRLIDFGVARHEYTSHGTLDGSISGKPPYMSPEQCQGQAVDGRSDIYALGIMLYTLLVGSPPFAGRNPLEVMRMHKESAVPFPETVPAVARALLVQTLAKDPNGRPSDLGVFRRELAALERVQ